MLIAMVGVELGEVRTCTNFFEHLPLPLGEGAGVHDGVPAGRRPALGLGVVVAGDQQVRVQDVGNDMTEGLRVRSGPYRWCRP